LGKGGLVILRDAVFGNLAGQRGHAGRGRGVHHAPAGVRAYGLDVEQIGKRAKVAAQFADRVVDVFRHQKTAVFARGAAARDGQRVVQHLVRFVDHGTARTRAAAHSAGEGSGIFV